MNGGAAPFYPGQGSYYQVVGRSMAAVTCVGVQRRFILGRARITIKTCRKSGRMTTSEEGNICKIWYRKECVVIVVHFDAS
jgi:recombinational DNA repair protein RecR